MALPKWLESFVGIKHLSSCSPYTIHHTRESLEEEYLDTLRITREQYPSIGCFNDASVTEYEAAIEMVEKLRGIGMTMPRLRDIPDFPEKPQHDAYTSLEMKDMGVVTAVIVGGQVVPNGPIKEGSTVVIISKEMSPPVFSWDGDIITF